MMLKNREAGGKKMPTNPTNKKAVVKTIRELLILVVTITVIYLLLAPSEHEAFQPVSVADLKGLWTTTHPGYQDRFLEFTDKTVTFGWGGSNRGSYTIDAIDSQSVDRETLVQIHYHDLATTDYQVSFFYMRQGNGMIRMKNQRGLFWSRTSDTPTHSPHFQ